jgi:hypothetical protein
MRIGSAGQVVLEFGLEHDPRRRLLLDVEELGQLSNAALLLDQNVLAPLALPKAIPQPSQHPELPHALLHPHFVLQKFVDLLLEGVKVFFDLLLLEFTFHVLVDFGLDDVP